MEKRKLGNSNIMLSEIGFGCASIWGKSFFDESSAIQLFYESIRQGITFLLQDSLITMQKFDWVDAFKK